MRRHLPLPAGQVGPTPVLPARHHGPIPVLPARHHGPIPVPGGRGFAAPFPAARRRVLIHAVRDRAVLS